MEFGSKYVYKYSLSEEESVSEDEEDILVEESSAKAAASSAAEGGEASASSRAKRKHLRKPDTNVLSIKFNRLLQPGEMHAGDPVYCSDCSAIASHLSKIEVPKKNDEENQEHREETNSLWHCEFCPKVNQVDIEQNDLPRQEDATYLIEPAPVVHGSDMTGVDDSIVFFLIDVSGSMSSTTLVQGTFQLPNALKLQQRAAEHFDGAHLIRQRHQTYVSRLQGVQMAVDANLDKLVKDAPTKRAALLTFNQEITYYGDGTREEPLVIRGDKLNSTDDLLREAEREMNQELKPVLQTKAKLTERVYDLEEGGQTALGPAVIFALSIASKRPGSRIVICTDGLANRGLGSLETAQDEKIDPEVKMRALDEGNRFYADITERAREKGVSISVITIKGTTCLLPVIGQMADGSGGAVTIVDLLNMRDEFASILEQQVIATNVKATLLLHRGLYIRDPDNLGEKLQKITRDIGNVTKQTEVTFEYGIRNKEEVKEKYHIDLDQLQQLPFQVQVTYTAADGSKALRVLTQLKEATEDRDVAETHAMRSVIAENHIRSTANDMMAAYSDDEEEEGDNAVRMLPRSKWSTPSVQKQRLAYMDNLKYKVRSRGSEEERFNERRWDAASHELQSHVKSSRARKSNEKPKASREHRYEADESSAVKSSRRTYGFASSKVARFDDTHSEHLYKYKNFSSDYMRELSPTREASPTPTDSASARSPPRRRRPSIEDKQSKSHSDDDDDDDDGIVVIPPKESDARTRAHRRTTKK